jgi:hypothetical protein
MTKYEKFTLIISGFAISLSIISPILSYFWLNSYELQLRYRPIIEVETREIISSDTNTIDFYMTISNNGKLPAKELQIVIEFVSSKVSLPDTNMIEISPYSAEEITKVNGKVVVDLNRPLGAGETTELSIHNIRKPNTFIDSAIRGRVYSEYGGAEFYTYKMYYGDLPL